MNHGHLQSGERINLTRLKEDMKVDASYALVKTNDMEVIRMSLPRGKTVEEHSLRGEVSVQCLKGHILFAIDGRAFDLTDDDWLFLEKEQPFSYCVKVDSILLVTILFS